jgi:hypothetical protein
MFEPSTILTSQMVGQLDRGCQVFYTEPQTQHEQDNSGIYEQDTAAKRECLRTLAWTHLKRLAALTAQTIYQLKYQWLCEYLIEELKHPSIRMQLI